MIHFVILFVFFVPTDLTRKDLGRGKNAENQRVFYGVSDFSRQALTSSLLSLGNNLLPIQCFFNGASIAQF